MDLKTLLVNTLLVVVIVVALHRFIVIKKTKTSSAFSKEISEFENWRVGSQTLVHSEGTLGEHALLHATGEINDEGLEIFLEFPFNHPDYETIKSLQSGSLVSFEHILEPPTPLRSTMTTSYLSLKKGDPQKLFSYKIRPIIN